MVQICGVSNLAARSLSLNLRHPGLGRTVQISKEILKGSTSRSFAFSKESTQAGYLGPRLDDTPLHPRPLFLYMHIRRCCGNICRECDGT